MMAFSHLPDEQLLLYASGELDAPFAERAGTHLESCDLCAARLGQLLNGLDEVREAQSFTSDAPLPSPTGPRALLKARLADSSPGQYSQGRHWIAKLAFANWRRGSVLAGLVLVLGLLMVRDRHATQAAQSLDDGAFPIQPIARFTPGAVVAVTQSQICSESPETEIPAELKTRVLKLYGIAHGHEDAYEVDYLITPELGGATDIRNLWPEPYGKTVWNAHVKDQLEVRLQQLVCHGNLDLATAQRDISTDWIAAYRKYFHVDAPVPVGSS
jgi:anti-sigma factor RsiW